MVNSGSFDAAGSEGESAKAEFTQLEDGDAESAPRSPSSPRHLTDFAAVVPNTNNEQPSPSATSSSSSSSSLSEERDEGLTTPPQATMTTSNTTSCCPPATPTKASLQCSVPLDKVKNVLEMCRRQSQTQSQSSSTADKTKLNNFFILENYLKQKQPPTTPNELQLVETVTTSTSNSNSSSETSKPTLKRLLCLFCDRTFTSNNLKQKHVDRCHSTVQTRRSSSRTSSQNQSATACCFCSKLNQIEHTLKDLFEHLINEHSNRYYACQPCQERFTNLQSLRDHNKTVHGIEEEKVVEETAATTVATPISDKIHSDVSERINKSDVAKSEAQVFKSSPSTASAKTKVTETKELTSKSVGFHVDFEDSILANVIQPDDTKDIKATKENDDSTSDTSVLTRKSRNSKTKPSTSNTNSTKNSSVNNNNNNKKISVKSTKNGVRSIRTTRASVKQLNNFNKTRKNNNKVKSDGGEQVEQNKQKSMCNPASVFSLVNAYIYKYEKIYDHASDSIKDANSVQFNAVFDRDFYLQTVCNIRENLLNHLDGKLNRNIESETRISHFEHNPALVETKTTNKVAADNFGCDLSLNAVTPVATLLASSQYGEDFDAQIEYGAKASQKKPKKVAVVKYKFPNKKYNSLFRERDGHTDLTSLDMWTQLTVKNRQNKVHDDGSGGSFVHLGDSPFFDRSSGFEAKHLVDELNNILDKRGPFEDLLMEANAAQFLELRKKSNKDGDYISEESSKDIYFILDEILNRVVSETDIKTENKETEIPDKNNPPEVNLDLPHYFQLQRSPNTNAIKIDATDTIAQICSSKDENDKSDKRLELTGEWTRPRIYICAACGLKLPNLKSLDDHKNNDHPHIWCSHYEFVGNQSQFYRHLSIPGLGKVSVIESQPQNRVWQKSDARLCTKCLKQCHNLGELHKHILECGGDWTWMLARKKCKYRPYGARTRRRRQRGYKRTCNPEVSRARELKPKSKPNFIGPRPKPSKPSDAETIERMLANLPPKRNRKMISMRDGIQRPRKPYKQNQNTSTTTSHLINNSQKPPNSSSKHFKNNSPQITKQTLRSALKRKLAMNNLRKQQKGTADSHQDNNVSIKLRSRKTDDTPNNNNSSSSSNNSKDEIKNKDTEPLSNKTKLRNKRMISRILGSKIFDSNTAIVTRRRLVKAITQNNLMRKTRLRTKMLEANALKQEALSQKEESSNETEPKTNKTTKVQQKQIEDIPKTVKPDKMNNLENSTIDKPINKKSNSKRFLSVLTKSSKKPKTTPETKIIDEKPDTISAVINDVVNMAHRDETVSEKTDSLEKLGLRRTRSSNKLDEENKIDDAIPTTSTETIVDNKTEIKKPDSNFTKTLGKRTSKLMQNVKSFGKNIRQQTTNENRTDPKNESIASKLIRTFSIRGSKRKKTNKTDETSSVISFEPETPAINEEEPLKKTTPTDDEAPNITNLTENSSQLAENPAETSKTVESEMPILEKINPLDEIQICDPIVLPVLQSTEVDQENEPKLDETDQDFKQSDEKLNASSGGALNKFKSKMKRPGRGLNDCIAMLKCKLEQKTIEPPLVDKSNLFILNSVEINKHSLVSEHSQINTEESTKPTEETPIPENTNSQDAMDLTMVSKVPTQILEVPTPKKDHLQKKEQIVEVSTVEIQTQTFEEDIPPQSIPEYLPHIQSNIQLSSLLNATLKNCLMECVKNKCEELRYDTQIVKKSNTKDRKIGSVRKRRPAKPKPSDAVDKPPLNIPLLLNTAFTEKTLTKPKLSSTNSPRTTTAEDTSEDDLPLSKLASSGSSVETKLKVNISVAKKKRSGAKKQIAFTPLILNSPDTCMPQISFQERLEQRISLENPATVNIKDEDKTKSETIKIETTTNTKNQESNVPNHEEPVEENPSSKSSISPEKQIEADKSSNETFLAPPLSEQIMSVEDEPLINYLVNKTLTETNVKPASSPKNAIPAENIELNKLDCIDSGKENSDIQGIKKQKKSVKKTRGKRKSKGKLNTTDSQIDYSTSLETTEKINTSSELTTSIEDNAKEEIKETPNIENEAKKTEVPLEQPEISNEETKKKLKSPKKTADVASIIAAIEAAIQSSIKIQDEIDNRNKRTAENQLQSEEQVLNLNEESNLISKDLNDISENNVGRRRKSRAKSKVNSESENLTPNTEENKESSKIEETKEPPKVEEIPVVKKRRGRAKKVTNEENNATPDNLPNTVEQPEMKRTTRTKPKVNYVETEILDPEVESMSEDSNDQSNLLNDADISEIAESLLEIEDPEQKRVTRGKKLISYEETEIEVQFDSETSVDKIENTNKEDNEVQVIADNKEKEEPRNIDDAQISLEIENTKQDNETIDKIISEEINKVEEINNAEKINPVKVKAKRGRKPKNKNKGKKIEVEPVVSSITEEINVQLNSEITEATPKTNEDILESEEKSNTNVTPELNNPQNEEETKVRSTKSSESEEMPESTTSSENILQQNKVESFLHPEEIKPKRRSRTKISETQNNLELMSSDDSSNNFEETKPKRKSRTRKTTKQETDNESNSDLDVATCLNSNESFVNPEEIKVKRRSRGKVATNPEIDNESMSSLNSDESSTNLEDIKLRRKSYPAITYEQEPDIPESKSLMETAFLVFNTTETSTKINQESDNIESNTDSETVSSNELNVSGEDKKIKRRSRKKPSLDNIVSRLTETVIHEEVPAIKQNSQSKITITIPLKTAATVPEVNSEDIEKPPLKITIANQKINQTNNEENSVHFEAKPKRKSRSKQIDNEKIIQADSVILPNENNFNNKFNLSFEEIKNKLKCRLEETENIEPNTTLEESNPTDQNSVSDENQIKRTPKLKITLANPESENIEAEPVTNSVENTPDIPDNKEKKKRKSFIKIKLNLPPEPELDEITANSIEPEITTATINESIESTENKKKRRYRKKELELLGAPTFENQIQTTETEAPSELQVNENPESMVNGEINKSPEEEIIENTNMDITEESVPKIAEEISLVKPEPKKRGRKPKNTKKNATLDSSNVPLNTEIEKPNLDTTYLQQLELEAENKEIVNTEHVISLQTAAELDEAFMENERKSRRSRPHINYQEIENDESMDLSSDSESSIKDNTLDESAILTEELPEEPIIALEDLDPVETINKSHLEDDSMKDTIVEQLPEEQTTIIPILETVEDLKPRKKRGRKKASVIIEENKEQTETASIEPELEIPSSEIQLPVETPKQRGRGRPSTKQKPLPILENIEILTPIVEEIDVASINEIEEFKRKSRCNINYEELENSTSIDSISNIELKVSEEPVLSTEKNITPHLPKKRGRKPKRKNIRQDTQTSVISEPISPENIAAVEEPPINEEIQETQTNNIPAEEEVPQIQEIQEMKTQEEQLPILKLDMKKRRQQTLENLNEIENHEEFNESASSDETTVHKIKKKRRSRSKNSETMSQQNIASAIELLTNVENTIESLKEFTKDKPLTCNFKNQLQENMEYEPESIMECKNIQELTSIPSLNVTVDISPAPVVSVVSVVSDSEDELPLSILIKSKPEGEDIIDTIPEISAAVNESSLISENSLLDISVDEINFTKAENKLILSTHNSFDFDDDNIIDQEELSQLVDITSETLLENIENDYISTIDTTKDKILDEIKQVPDETDLDEIIEDLEIVTKLKTDPPASLDTLATIDKSAEELLNLIEAQEEDADFIKTPDLKDTSLIIKIKKNFNVHIRKAKKSRRRVIPKSLNKNNIRRKEEDEHALCEICNKSFKRKETLASHKRTLTHIAKLSEIEARESQAKRLIENEEEAVADVIKPSVEILNADESSCENNGGDVPEIVNAAAAAPQKPLNNILPGLIVNSTNSTLKLIDIINEVLDKPVSINDDGYSPRSIRKSPTRSCDSTETFSEPTKRYKSLGERKSFDSDSYTMTPKCNEPETIPTLKPITNGEILCKQLSILENIIEETNPSLNNYIDDSVSLSSSQFEEPLPEPKDIDYTKFSHSADVLSSFIKPNHFNNFENISQSFTKPINHQEIVVPQNEEEDETKKKDNSTRKILNRDEELFLECCSLLKSGPEISGSKKSTKQIQLNSFSRSNDASWIMQKQQNSDRFIQRDSYSWLAQSSRVETPIGEPFVNNDWSNSNSAVSSEWLAQKAPSPDRPTESNTILKKSNNNSEESKYTDLRFEDISIDSSLETSKTLMAVEHSNTENIPLDFHNVDFANSNLQQTHQIEPSNPEEESSSKKQPDEDTSSRDDFDPELKKKVVSAFGGLMAKALTNRLHAVVRKSKKSKGRRDLDSSAIQSSITDYTIPVKKTKPNQTDSDSSDCPKKLITKGAMKVFEGIKVSIPTQDLNLKEVLNKTKKTEEDIVEIKTILEKEKEDPNKNGKVKHLFGRFGNKLGLREKKKTMKKRSSPKTKSKNIEDVYEFEESQDKSTFSLFKYAKENNVEQTTTTTATNNLPQNEEEWNMDSESDTDRYYDSMSFEEQSLSSESTPESNTTPIKLKPVVSNKKTTDKSKDNQKKCMIMGRIFRNASKPKLEDKIPEIRDFTSEENSKVVENYLDSCSSVENVENGIVEAPAELVPNNNSAAGNSANKMSKKEMDMLFDKLLEEEIKMHEKEKLEVVDSKTEQNEDVFSKPLATVGEKKKSNNKVKPKKRQRHNSDSTSSDEFRLGGRQSKSTKRPKTHRKPPKPKKESGINLEQEMKECIGVAGRKSQRKCTSGKQNVLVEFWSSDESSFEEVLTLIGKENPINIENEIIEQQIETEDINEIIQEKEETKKASLDIYDFDSDAESKIEEFHPKPQKPEDLEESEFLAVNKMKIPKRIPKPKRNRKHSKSHDIILENDDDDESASEYEAEKTRRRNEHRRKKMLESSPQMGENGEGIDAASAAATAAECLAISRRKRNAGDQLYYWSSSSDDEMQDLIEVKPIREDTDDDRPMHHGWIVGDSPKKLVTMLAQAKGKKIDGGESVKEQGKKNRVTL